MGEGDHNDNVTEAEPDEDEQRHDGEDGDVGEVDHVRGRDNAQHEQPINNTDFDVNHEQFASSDRSRYRGV